MQSKVNWTYPKGLNLVRLGRLSRSLSANTLIIVCCFDRDAGAQGATKPSKNNQAAHVTLWAGVGRGIPRPEILSSLTLMLSVHITAYSQGAGRAQSLQEWGVLDCALHPPRLHAEAGWSLWDAEDAVVHCLQRLLEFTPWWTPILCLKRWITQSEQAQCWGKPHSTLNVPSEKLALCHCVLRQLRTQLCKCSWYQCHYLGKALHFSLCTSVAWSPGTGHQQTWMSGSVEWKITDCWKILRVLGFPVAYPNL